MASPVVVATMSSQASGEDAEQLRQCERIIQFRDRVLSGTHPTIKPAHLSAKPAGKSSPPESLTRLPLPPTTKIPSQPAKSKSDVHINGGKQMTGNLQSFQLNARASAVNMSTKVPGLGSLGSTLNGAPASQAAPKVFGNGETRINPILLEKSDDLIRAEMKLQRQRLESALREQIDQRRNAMKAALQPSEPLPDFDLADVLSKALALVQASAAQPADDTGANASASSDSFDDNTFYSSRHDTPESPQLSRIPNETEDDGLRDGSPYEPQLDIIPMDVDSSSITPAVAAPAVPAAAAQPQPSATTLYPLIQYTPSFSPGFQTGFQSGASATHPLTSLIPANRQQADSSNSARGDEVARPTGEFSYTDKSRDAAQRRHSPRAGEQLGNGGFQQQDPAVVRAHNLSPIAPQPNHVSPLATARQPPASTLDAVNRRGTPAQIAALRKGPSEATTPESSPQGNTATDKRKKKLRRKRKAERLAADAAATPYIKPEPRSPSPISAPSLPRPSKRRRHSQRQNGAVERDEPGHPDIRLVEDVYQARPQQLGAQQDPTGYAHPGNRNVVPEPRHTVHAAYAPTPVRERDLYENERPVVGSQRLESTSPSSRPVPYYAETRNTRPASRAAADYYYYDDVTSRQEFSDSHRVIARPGAIRGRSRSPVAYDRSVSAMGPPRSAQSRVVVDEFGREYQEPSRLSTVIRQSVAPVPRAGEPEGYYERLSHAPASSRPPELFEENGVIYRRVSPSYLPRRVVTQPEYGAPPEYRPSAYREVEYPTAHTVSIPAEDKSFTRMRPGTMAPPDSAPRAVSVHPAGEVLGYERRMPDGVRSEYLGTRAVSVRPVLPGYERLVVDQTPREYPSMRAASVRPAASTPTYEVVRDYAQRPGSVRPDYVRKYPPIAHQELLREAAPVDGRSYAALQPYGAEGHVVRRAYSVRPPEAYYPPPQPRGD